MNIHNIPNEITIPHMSSSQLLGITLFQAQYPEHPLILHVYNGIVTEVMYKFLGRMNEQRIWAAGQILAWIRDERRRERYGNHILDWSRITIVNIT